MSRSRWTIAFFHRWNSAALVLRNAALTVCAAFSLCLLGMQPALAGSQTGYISALYIRDTDGLVYVHLAGSPTGRPPCAANSTYWMVPNENSETGKKLFALLLAAKLANQQVQIVGKNTCARWGDGEDINSASPI